MDGTNPRCPHSPAMLRLHAQNESLTGARGAGFPEGFVAVTAARIVTYPPAQLSTCNSNAMESSP
jgi:hypothetical protein